MGVRLAIRSAEGQPLSEELAYEFEQARIVIGRGAGADVRIPHLTISEVHATLRQQDEAYVILDNDSTNGTRVNGTRVSGDRPKRLHDGDLIEVGAYVLHFRSGVALRSSVTIERTAELARRLFRNSHAGARIGAPRIVVLGGPLTGHSLDIAAPPARVRVGRGEECQLVLPDTDVSREHCELVHDLDGVLLHNLDSKNGIDINGQRVMQRRLRDGDEIVLGTTRLLFEEPAEEPIDALGTEDDRPLAKPAAAAPAGAAAPVESAVNPGPGPAEPAEAPVPMRKPPARASFDADVIIYALAAIVIAISVAGLILLMRGE
jgi:pSer/pThr/pTyr-binding forkhead associated (FHA) protein